MVWGQKFFLFLLGLGSLSAIFPGTLYIVGFNSGSVLAVDPLTGTYSSPVSIPFDFPVGIALGSFPTAYVSSWNGFVYEVDLTTGACVQKNPVPIPESLGGISLLNSTTAIAATIESNRLYSIDLRTGTFSAIFVFPAEEGSRFPDVKVANSKIAYVVNYDNNHVFEVDLARGWCKRITTEAVGAPGNPGLRAIQLTHTKTAYVLGANNGKVYSVDLTTGSWVPVTEQIDPKLYNLEGFAVNGATAYVTGHLDSRLYSVDLLTGIPTLVNIVDGANNPGFAYSAFHP